MKIGDVFGELEVIGRAKRGGSYFTCRCSCGVKKDIHGSNIGRNVNSCGGRFHIDKLWVGRTAGRLTVIAGDPDIKYVLCQCSCGNKKRVSKSNFGKCIFACGCLRNEMAAKRVRTHGASAKDADPKMKAMWACWRGMKSRCTHLSRPDYKHYGGRGITYDEKYESFPAFRDDFIDQFKIGLEIDRVDVNGNYTKSNIRFCTHKQQVRNTRKTLRAFFLQEMTSVRDIADTIDVPFGRLRSRLRKGMDIDEAITKPSRYDVCMVGVKRPRKAKNKD